MEEIIPEISFKEKVLEFVLTYSWVILLGLIGIGLLIYLYVKFGN